MDDNAGETNDVNEESRMHRALLLALRQLVRGKVVDAGGWSDSEVPGNMAKLMAAALDVARTMVRESAEGRMHQALLLAQRQLVRGKWMVQR